MAWLPPMLIHVPLPRTLPPAQNELVTMSMGRYSFVCQSYSTAHAGCSPCAPVTLIGLRSVLSTM